ncbi:MAG TPA: rRNA methyltransferase [Spongiibacteraceae bacterium]|nr:rRNA methyltransferase [Spongiibacteraceae bacterium]HCS26773.1 rRNA methyltransferase [Spongiibacteraceae bacterium]|tara:strand:- start:426 stop:1445 length:1020 start_codon:yes stop_codon:yes gene_type:complete
MKDAALEALYKKLDLAGPGLLLADEQCTEPPPNAANVQVLTHRVDVARRFEAAGFSCVLNDFLLPAVLPASVYYRVSKEKPLVHYLLNAVLAALPIGGRLLLSGYKGDGTKTYIEKACAMVGASKSVEKGAGGALLAIIEKRKQPVTTLDDSGYAELQLINAELSLFSKPGIYGWKKIDSGSALLAEQIPALLDTMPARPASVLDLGCGYGYLSVIARQYLPEARFVATDNNVTALLACAKNFDVHNIAGDTLADDCGAAITEKFDLIVCNPPFHKGFDVHGDLTLQFLQSAQARLKRGASAVFVVNQFIGLEQRAKQLFGECRLLAERDGFKVFLLKA